MPTIGSIVDEASILYKYYESDYRGRTIFGRVSGRTRTSITVKYWYDDKPHNKIIHHCPAPTFQRFWIPFGKILNRRSFD